MIDNSYETETDNSKLNVKQILLEVAMKFLKNIKSPGDDKLPNELFIHAGKDLKESLLRIINTFYKKAEIPSNWKSIVIKMLFKGKGKKVLLKNWRGIFLTVALSKE